MAETKKKAAAIQDARLDRLERVLGRTIQWLAQSGTGKLDPIEAAKLLKALNTKVEDETNG